MIKFRTAQSCADLLQRFCEAVRQHCKEKVTVKHRIPTSSGNQDFEVFYNFAEQVSGRELHLFLESKQEFSNWIKNRIEKYGFVKNQDFEVFDNLIRNPQGGRPLTEYILSMDCAKEIKNATRDCIIKIRKGKGYF